MGPPLQFRCSLRERCKPQLGRSVHHSRNGARPTDCAPQYVMISARLYSAHVMHNAASPAPANQTTTFLRIRIAPGTLKSGSCFSSPKNCSALWLSLDTCGLTCIAIKTRQWQAEGLRRSRAWQCTQRRGALARICKIHSGIHFNCEMPGNLFTAILSHGRMDFSAL